jgi:hypothetical protein
MNLRLTAAVPLPLLLSCAILAAAQVPNIQPPPIKMGLWQSTVTITSSAMGPASHAGSSTHQSCYTPDSWKESMESMQSRAPQDIKCTTSNIHQDSHSVSFDGECDSQQGYTVTYHVEMFLDSDSAMHGTSNAKMSGPMFPQGMSISSAISSKFISPDCGDIKPGGGRSVH